MPTNGSAREGIGFMNRITAEYLNLQKKLHETGNYGLGVDAQECFNLLKPMFPAATTVLDYGCGQGHFKRLAGSYFDVSEYDPCIPGKDAAPSGAHVVVCADVLEHVEADCLERVLDHIWSLARQHALFVVATGPSRKLLADGRNAHITLKSPEAWREILGNHFKEERFEARPGRGVLFMGNVYA